MTHVFALIAINSLFGAALYSADSVVKQSLFNTSAMIALAYALMLIFLGPVWLLASLMALFVAIEAFRRGHYIQSASSNREWVELQIVHVLILITVAYVQQLSVVMMQATMLVVFMFIVFVINILMRRHVSRHAFSPSDSVDDDDLPTVSLLIPARNEDHALQETLDQALESSYPKLEILVLDDCSGDKTPEIIRSYAHKGIRFVEGQPLTDDWLGKNFALEQLRKSANGDIHIYADVDVQVQPQTIRELVTYMLQEQLSMVSVLPARRGFDVLPMFIRPIYEFAITLAPFGALKTARTYGSFFAITKKVARNYSFEQAKNNFIPEQPLATKLKAANRYESIIGDWALGVTTRKRLNSQIQAQQRSLYPLFGSSTFGCALYCLALLMLAVLPFFVLPIWLALTVYTGYTIAYVQYLFVHSPQSVFMAPIQLGLLLVVEASMALYSLVTFSFGELAWKDRKICVVPATSK